MGFYLKKCPTKWTGNEIMFHFQLGEILGGGGGGLCPLLALMNCWLESFNLRLWSCTSDVLVVGVTGCRTGRIW